MKLAIINCSIRRDNTTAVTAELYHTCATARSLDSTVVTIEPFDKLFVGDYITADTATVGQKTVIDTMTAADCLLFVVPTYYKSLPGSAKNFFDIVKCPEIYAEKVIGFVASNHKNQDYGARHAAQIVGGLLIFFAIRAVIIPDIAITDPSQLLSAEADRFLAVLETFHAAYK